MFTSIILSLGLALTNGVGDVNTVAICETSECLYNEYEQKYEDFCMNNKGGFEGIVRREPEMITCSKSSGKRLFDKEGRTKVTIWEKNGIRTYFIMENNEIYVSFDKF